MKLYSKSSEKEARNKSVGQGSVVSRRQLGLRIESRVGGRELVHEWVNKKKQDKGGWGRERHKGWVRKKGNSKVKAVKGQESTFRTGMRPGTLDTREPQAFKSAQFVVPDMFLVLHVCPMH